MEEEEAVKGQRAEERGVKSSKAKAGVGGKEDKRKNLDQTEN